MPPASPAPPLVLSIQSRVAYGHVGNSAAQGPLMALGCHPVTIDTVLLSNHPGHGSVKGGRIAVAEQMALIDGLITIGVAQRAAAILSGYLGAPEAATTVLRALEAAHRNGNQPIYLLDPVMGDVEPDVTEQSGGQSGGQATGRLYVDPAIPEAIRTRLLPEADIITPNRFELEILSGTPIRTLADARAAALGLMRAHPPLSVIVTSFDGVETPADAIDTLLFQAKGGDLGDDLGDGLDIWRCRQPRLGRRFDGAGDCFAALLLGHRLTGADLPTAMAAAIAAMEPLLHLTAERGARDLALVEALPGLAARRPPPAPERLG